MLEKEMLELYRLPAYRPDVILDTDTYNEVDDQFAIAYALKSREKLNIVGFTCAPFKKLTRAKDIGEGQLKSYEETKKVLRLDGETALFDRVHIGCDRFLPDEETPVNSDAVEFIVKTSKNYNKVRPLYLLATGAITNIASAILVDPTIVDRICVVWLGGQALGWWNNEEYNMKQDIAAARVLIGSKTPFVQVPARGVASDFLISGFEMENWLKGKNPLCDFLYENCEQYIGMRSEVKTWSKIIWDVVVVAWLLNENDRFMSGRVENRYLPEYGSHLYAEKPLDLKMLYVYQIHRDALINDLFEKLRGEKL